MIILLFVVWVLEGNWTHRFKALQTNKFFFIPVLFYFLHVVGLSLTANLHEGYNELMVKLSLLLLPLIIGSNRSIHKININYYLTAFVTSNFFAASLCLILATLRTIFKVPPDLFYKSHFFYSPLSIFIHVSYFGMMQLFSLTICIYFAINNTFKLRWTWLGLAVLFLFMIFLLSSKGTFVAAVACFIAAIIYEMFYGANNKIGVLLCLVIGVFVFSIILYNNPRSKSLQMILSDAVHPNQKKLAINSNETNTERSLINRIGYHIFINNLLTGVGTGDAKDELLVGYAKQGMKDAYHKKLNAHNQYLETAIQLGIAGILCFVFLLVFSIYKYIKMRSAIGLLFVIGFAFSNFSESMLNVQVGVVYFALFLSIMMTGEHFRSSLPEPPILLSKDPTEQ